MDDLVKAALIKWPHVPHCYGWLGLDARGNWYLRDDQAQAAGPFCASRLPALATLQAADPARAMAAKGSMLKHDKLIDFIQRNYASDADGQWFFQNGPQRVYVELEAAPFVWRITPDFAVTAHTGQPVQAQHCLVDEWGRVYLLTERGLGLVHTQDMTHLADAIEQGLWQPQEALAQDLPQRYGFVLSPNARHNA